MVSNTGTRTACLCGYNGSVDERTPKRSVADDPEFLAEIEELDRGLAGANRGRPAPADTAPAMAVEPTRSAAPPPPPVHAADGATTGLPLEPGARRPLLDLFPPPAARLPDSAARGTAAAARQIPPRDSRGEPRESTPRPRRDETFYGFVEPAFSLAPDPRFYFHSTEQDRAARELVDAIGRREQLLVVVGAPGIGKTMLCYAVAQQLDRRTLAAVVAAPPPTVDALVQALLVEFGLASRDASESSATARLGTLREFLSSLAARGASVLVAIDNAHTAAPDMLRALVALSNEAPRTLQIVLAGTASLAALLERRDLFGVNQHVTRRVSLGPLAADEISGYVMHRVNIAAAGPRVEFDDTAIARLYDVSAGVPRLINQVCDRALTRAFEASATLVDGDLILAAAVDVGAAPASAARHRRTGVAIALGFVAGGVAAAWIFRDRLQAILVHWPLFR